MKKKKKKKIDPYALARALQRKLAMQQGFYDGRFKQRIVKDRKKEAGRRKARGKVKEAEE